MTSYRNCYFCDAPMTRIASTTPLICDACQKKRKVLNAKATHPAISVADYWRSPPSKQEAMRNEVAPQSDGECIVSEDSVVCRRKKRG